ncbi:uncharacterized protein H6S33_003189 [Morchella sextelata]|jgi:hypothetical protein|uniref:uncharacterized protein n=1 Tax=Morchella sextelata TaxID=1174677 RepID=UPI001D05A3D9|nr:uncharacterized protein H6S33_003189 [Morchella sextelata]KAH0607201.1 hypothetical protein H6S33_003189 [Morchella sextelata]
MSPIRAPTNRSCSCAPPDGHLSVYTPRYRGLGTAESPFIQIPHPIQTWFRFKIILPAHRGGDKAFTAEWTFTTIHLLEMLDCLEIDRSVVRDPTVFVCFHGLVSGDEYPHRYVPEYKGLVNLNDEAAWQRVLVGCRERLGYISLFFSAIMHHEDVASFEDQRLREVIVHHVVRGKRFFLVLAKSRRARTSCGKC